MAATEGVFWMMVAATGSLDLLLIATLAVPSLQAWPPPGRRTWQYRCTWTLFILILTGFLVVGGLDSGSLGLRR